MRHQKLARIPKLLKTTSLFKCEMINVPNECCWCNYLDLERKLYSLQKYNVVDVEVSVQLRYCLSPVPVAVVSFVAPQKFVMPLAHGKCLYLRS